MYIKQLEIDNFKSFANRVEVPLLKGFTTVSGPNGSGKSNIIDSILFALGLSNSRALRAVKIADFISTYTKKNEAIVRVTFGDVPDGEDFSIARKIKKSSQGYNSIYYLNDKTVTLSDVHVLLEKYNITPNSYNVMMQDDVRAIVNCNTNERRKIIDEIAGIADFDRRIDQATEELNTVEERVEKSSIILNEVDTRLEQLKEEREVALKYQKLREEKNGLESQVNTVKFFDLKRNLEKAHENILQANKRKKEEEVKVKDLDERLKLVNTKYEEVSALVREKGEAHQIEVKKQAEETKGLIDRKQTAIHYADQQIQSNLKASENAKNGIEQQNKHIDELKMQIKMKQDEIGILSEDLTKERAELQKILQEMTGLNQTADQHIERRNSLRKELENLQDKENNLIKEKLPLEAELNSLQKELANAKEKLEKFETFKNNYSQNKDKLDVQVEELKKDLGDYKIIQANAMNDLDTTKNEIDDLNYSIQAAYKKISQMEAHKQAAEDANYGRAVDTVMNSGLSGVHAPLAKLGKVDKEYATALEIAIGGRMAHVVVDDDHVASVAIEMLRSSNAGRATFIPLNKVKKAPDRLQLPKDKGVIDFAINLIDFDDEYLNAFFYAVGDTLVVEDMDSARKLIGKYRMVTLAGDLLEKSGSMTGGSVRSTGLKFSQNDDDELNTYKARLKEMELKYGNLENKRKTLEEKLEKVRSDYSNTMTECNKAQVELNSMVNSSTQNETAISAATAFITETEPKISEISKKLDKMEEKHIDISDNMTDIQSKIEEVEKLIDDKDLKDLKEKTKGQEDKISRLTNNISNATNDITMKNKEIDFTKGVIESKYSDIKRHEDNNKALEADKVRFADEIKVQKDKLEDLEKQIEQINEKLAEFLKQRDEITAELNELKTKKHVKESDLELIAEQIESFKARRRELEPQLEAAKTDLEESGIKISELEPVETSIDEINAKIQRLQRRMDDLGMVNMRALEAYDEVLKRQEELKTQIETLANERKEILERMQGFEQLKKETFMKTYNNISVNFKEMFNVLSEGEGALVLDNPEDPLAGGLTIEAQPRDKKKQRLESMSGGEKSITALAFVFAIQRYMPSPFYAFDEVDGSLDSINVEKLANLIQKQCENTQFIVVSHRKPMIESADRTIGVTQKEKGISQVTGIKRD